MKHLFKKSMSVLLCLTMLICVAVPMLSVGATNEKDIPIVYLEGQGHAIYNAAGEQIYGGSKVRESVVNTLKDPDFLKALLADLTWGMATQDWSRYCDTLYNGLNPILSAYALDKNGEASDGSYCGAAQQNKVKNKTSNFALMDYVFRYDWRLDACANAKLLAEYIDKVRSVTGYDKVTLVSRCEGCCVASAYVAQEGYEKIDSYLLYVQAATGMDLTGALFSGQLSVDPDTLDQYVTYIMNSGLSDDDALISLVTSFVSLLNQVKALGVGTDVLQSIIDAVRENVVPRLLLSSYGTFPSYWAMVNEDFYDDALQFIFSTDEKRQEYAGLIEKIENYHDNVQVGIADMLLEMKANGISVSNIAKYGYNALPIYEEANEQADGFADLRSSSMGATSSLLYTTLSDDYLKTADPKYISADKVVDASTCLLPDNTWIIKNLEHSYFPSSVDALIMRIVKNEGFDVNSDENYPQFLYYKDNTIAPLTGEEETEEKDGWTNNFLKIVMRFISSLLRKIADLFTAKK